MKRFAVSLALLALPSLASASDPQLSLPEKLIDQRLLDRIAAPITSRAALDGYLRRMPPQSPLLALPTRSRNEFLDSLIFTERGLASYRYVPLQQIDIADAYRILALFGVQGSLAVSPAMRVESANGSVVRASLDTQPTPIDYPGYACLSKATCADMPGSVCIGDNC